MRSEMVSKLSRIENDSTTDWMATMRVEGLSKVQKNGRLKFSLPNSKDILTAQVEMVEAKSAENYVWRGVFPNDEGHMTLMSENGTVNGYIYHRLQMYQIYGIGENVSVMICRSKKVKSHCATKDETIKEPKEEPKPPVKPRGIVPCRPSNVRVLFLTTANAREVVPNINQAINNAVAQYNGSLAASGISNPVSNMVVAAAQNVEDVLPGFTEDRDDILGDIEEIAQNPQITNLRRAVLADIVVMFTNANYRDPQFRGIGGAVREREARFQDAYTIVEVESAIDNSFTFSHEIGHLFGGLHNTDPDVVNTVGTPLQPYAHAFTFTASPNFLVSPISFGTVMFPFSGGATERIDKYSNPLVTLFREPTGTADFANVARRVNESTLRIASFEDEPGGVRASIVGVGTIDPSRTASYAWDAATSCGTPPYTYQWSANFNGFDYVLQPDATEDEYFFTYIRRSQYRLRGLSVLVTDNTGNSTTAFKTITYRDELGVGVRSEKEGNDAAAETPDGVLLSEDLMASVFPNPAKDRLTVGINGENTEGVSLELIDAQGKIIAKPVKVFSESRQVIAEFDTRLVANGLYLIKITHSKNITTKKVIIQK